MARDTVLRIVAVVSSSLLIAYLTLATQCFTSGLRLTTWFVGNMVWTSVVWMVLSLRAQWAADAARSRDRRQQKKLRKQMQIILLVCSASLIAFLSCDTIYNIALQRIATPLPFQFERSKSIGGLEIGLRLPRYRVGEGGRNKPFGVIGGEVYGELVPPRLVDHRDWQEKVVERRRVEYRLDEHGYRNPIGAWREADWVAVGDSFVFGAGIDVESTWVEQCKAAGLSIYNMGESGTGPVDQWQRLQELVSGAANEKLQNVIWMFFGGNDLQVRGGSEFAEDSSQVLAGTLLVGPLRGIEAVRDDSLLGRLRTGRVARLRYPPAYWFQGQLLPAPLYEHKRGGAKLFYAPYIEEARRSEASLLGDGQLGELQRVWEQLGRRAQELGWRVLMVYAPSAEHLLGSDYEGFPETAPPHLATWLEKQAEERGFAYLNVSGALSAGSETELPYFRDDTHWNSWGHAIVHQAITAKLSELGWHNTEFAAEESTGNR
jgi:lysophospholipase L1-like esterase